MLFDSILVCALEGTSGRLLIVKTVSFLSFHKIPKTQTYIMKSNRASPPTTSCSMDSFRSVPIVSPLVSPRNSLRSYRQLHEAVSPTPSRSKVIKNHRGLFALQIKYLLHVLKNAHEDKLLEKAKNCIAACTRMNRAGDPRYSPLQTVLELQLRSLVGNLYWELAQSHVRQHLRRSRYQRLCANEMALRNVALIRARRNSVAI